jgi:hypothetical protein
MAAKKRRGLGGSPEHHASAAKTLYQRADEYYESAAKNAAKGNCSASWFSMMSGRMADGEGLAHARESSPLVSASSIAPADTRKRATLAFEKNCLVGKGLSSLGRTSKRRPARRKK